MLVKQGTTGKTAGIFVRKSDGTAYTGLAYNASGFKCYYVREGGSSVSVTLSGTNWTETDATNLPGRYKFIIPDAALAAGANYVEFVFSGASDMLPVPLRIELVAFDPFTDFTAQVTSIKTQTDQFTWDPVTDKLETAAYNLGSFSVNSMVSSIWGANAVNQSIPDSIGLLVNNMATNVSGVKAKTDQFRFTMANMVDSTVYGIYTAQAQQIADAVWESFPGDYGGAGAALAEIQTNVNGIINTYDGQGFIKAIMMDLDPGPRYALAAEIWGMNLTAITPGTTLAADYLKGIKATTDVFGRDGGGYISIGSVTGAVGTVSNGVDLSSSAIESVATMVLDGDMSIFSTPGSLAVVASDIKAKTDQLVFDTGKVRSVVYGFDLTASSGIANSVWNAMASGFTGLGTMGGNFGTIFNKTSQLNFTGTDVKATLDGETVAVASLSAAALNAINVEVDAALNTVIPTFPTAGSINDKLNTLSFYEGKLRAYPEGGYVDSVSNYVPINPSVLASIWSYPTSSISAAGSIGLQLKNNLDTTITSRAASGAAMTLADGAITSAKIAAGAIQSGAFAQGAINNFVLADDIAIDSVTTVWGDIMGNVSGNVLGSVGSVVLPVEATFSGNVTLAQATIDAVATQVWVTNGRALTSAVDVSTDDIAAIRSGLAATGDLTFLATASQVGQILQLINPPVPHDQGLPASFTYHMVNASGDPIEGVTIRVTRDREGTDEVMPDKVTNALGETGWVLFTGTYYVTRTKDGQAYTNPDIWRIQG